MTNRPEITKNKSHIKLGLSEASLRALLDRDAERGALVADRGKKISRRHYAEQLGCTKGNLTRFIEVFSEYEANNPVAAVPSKFFDEMKQWLTDAYEKRELQFHNGKIQRLQFREEFKISDGIFLERYPEIASMFADIETRAHLENYTTLAKEEAIERRECLINSAPVSVAEPKTATRLRFLLEADAANGCLVSDLVNKISRRHYAEMMGCTPSNLVRFVDIFSEYEQKFGVITKLRDLASSVMAENLRRLLEVDGESGCLVADRGGKISRRYYSKALGCTAPNLTRFTDIFADFEKKYEVETGPLRNLNKMRSWLTERFEKKELGFRDGKVDRIAFCEHFALRGGAFLIRKNRRTVQGPSPIR